MSDDQIDSISLEHSEGEQVPPIERQLRVKIGCYPDESPKRDSVQEINLALPCESEPEPVPDVIVAENTIVEKENAVLPCSGIPEASPDGGCVPQPVPDVVIAENTTVEKENAVLSCSGIPEVGPDPVEKMVMNDIGNQAVSKSTSKPEEGTLGNQLVVSSVIMEQVGRPYQQSKDERIAEKIDNIMSDLCDEIIESSEGGTCCDSCMDCCCYSFSCNCINPCQNCCMCDSETKLSEKMTPALRRARNKGLSILKKIAFPVVTDLVRDIWVVLELVTVLLGLGMSITNAVLHEVNFISLFATSLGTFFALLDGFCVLRHCRSCKACCCNHRAIESQEVPKMNCCYSCLKNSSDIVRMIISEVLIYPTLMYSIFNVIKGKAYEGETHIERVGFSLFLLSCISLVLYVYVVRLIAVGGIIKGVWEVRIPRDNYESHDISVALSALLYQLYFAIHVFLQMLVQVLMIIAIAAKIRYEYRPFYMDEISGEPKNSYVIENSFNGTDTITNVDPTDPIINVGISNHLLYMLVTGFFLTPMGFVSFFVVTYYWSQEMPIGLLIDMISIYRKGNRDVILGANKLIIKQKETVQNTVDVFFQMDTLLEEFNILRNVSFSTKFMYPFKSPMPIIFCLTYGLLLASFVISAAVTYDEMGNLVIYILNGGGWTLYYIIACVIGALANVYALFVAAVWVAIITIVITLVILTIISFCLGGDKKTKDNNNNNC